MMQFWTEEEEEEVLMLVCHLDVFRAEPPTCLEFHSFMVFLYRMAAIHSVIKNCEGFFSMYIKRGRKFLENFNLFMNVM